MLNTSLSSLIGLFFLYLRYVCLTDVFSFVRDYAAGRYCSGFSDNTAYGLLQRSKSFKRKTIFCDIKSMSSWYVLFIYKICIAIRTVFIPNVQTFKKMSLSVYFNDRERYHQNQKVHCNLWRIAGWPSVLSSTVWKKVLYAMST